MVVVAIVTVYNYDRRSDRMPFVHGLIRVPYSGSYSFGCTYYLHNMQPFIFRLISCVLLQCFQLLNFAELKSTLSVFRHDKV